METKFECLSQLDRDLRGAAARERLEMEETERGAGFPPPAAPLPTWRGTSPAPRRWTKWPMLAAASLVALLLAGTIGFLATGGSPVFFDIGGAETAPVPQAATGPVDPGLGYTDEEPGRGGFILDPASPAPAEDAGSTQGGQRDLSKIIRDGRIGIVIPDGDFQATRLAVNDIALANDGFVLSSSTRGRIGTFVLRVPAARFEAALAAISDLGKVEFETQDADDVTAEFIDLQARRNLLLAEKRVLSGFLADATTVSETLSLFNRVQDVQLQLERVQGQLRFIRDQVAESTIRVQIRERAVKAETLPQVDQPSLGRAWERGVQGFLNVLAAVVVGLGYLIPAGAIAVVLWLVVRAARKRTDSSEPATP